MWASAYATSSGGSSDVLAEMFFGICQISLALAASPPNNCLETRLVWVPEDSRDFRI